MFRNVPTPVLAALAAGALILDLGLAGPIADASNPGDVLTPMPAEIPISAFLTGKVQDTTQLDGIQMEIVAGNETPYALRLTNPSEEALQLAFRVDAWESSGLSIGRMGPARTQLGTQDVIIAMPAHTTVVHPLPFARTQPLIEPAPQPTLALTAPAAPNDSNLSIEIAPVEPSSEANTDVEEVAQIALFPGMYFASTEFGITPMNAEGVAADWPMAYLVVDHTDELTAAASRAMDEAAADASATSTPTLASSL